MTRKQWYALAILVVLVVLGSVLAYLVGAPYLGTGVYSDDPDYLAVWEIMRLLYYGSRCEHLMTDLNVDGVIEMDLIECQPADYSLVNVENGAILRADTWFWLEVAWLPSGEKVVIDVRNEFLFEVEDGKVVDFYPITQERINEILSQSER